MAKGSTAVHDRVSGPIPSTDPDINTDREHAIELIKKLGKTPYKAKESDKKWFWDDMDQSDIEKYPYAKELVAAKYEELDKRYPFALTEWLMNWYRFMPDVLSLNLSNTGPIDWNLFFTLIYPDPPLDSSSFQLVIRALNIEQNRKCRESIYEEIVNDPVLRDKVLKGEPIPSVYTHFTPYHKIYNEVIRRTKSKKTLKSFSKSDHELFKAAYRLMRAENISSDEALRRLSCVQK